MIVDADTVTAVRWKNGGGWARDLLRWPPFDSKHPSDDCRVRISLADITAEGPFSPYPGVQRWFAVVEGAGVVLDFAGAPHTQRTDTPPLCFDGAVAPGCGLLDGPTRALNLMLRGVRGVLRRADTAAPWAEPWPLRGHYDVVTRQLAWALPAGPLAAPGPGFWIGIDA